MNNTDGYRKIISHQGGNGKHMPRMNQIFAGVRGESVSSLPKALVSMAPTLAVFVTLVEETQNQGKGNISFLSLQRSSGADIHKWEPLMTPLKDSINQSINI